MSNHITLSQSVHLLPLGSKHIHTVQLVPDVIFSKLEVGRLDSRLSLFIIISSYIHTLSWCQMVVGIQIAFKTIQTENWEIESKEDHLTVIELRNIQVELKYEN